MSLMTGINRKMMLQMASFKLTMYAIRKKHKVDRPNLIQYVANTFGLGMDPVVILPRLVGYFHYSRKMLVGVHQQEELG